MDQLLLPSESTVTAAAVPDVRALHRGDVLAGRFSILRCIGRGGMGEVYEADDRELGGKLALKVIRPDLVQSPDSLARFRREVQIARQVTHPNVCRIFDLGYDADRVFLTMELLEGEGLNRWLVREHELRADRARGIARQIAAGLQALHEKGIVHRDLKPGNIMITAASGSAPRAVITDFGLARAADSETQLSVSGLAVGTPDYMSPEQMLGATATTASDIYSFGLILYELATGRRAARTPNGHDSVVAGEWRDLVPRCLSRDPVRRPTAAELVSAFDGSLRLPTPKPALWKRGAWTTAALVVGAGLWYGGRLQQATQTPGARDTHHIAFLPLNVLGGEPELRVFASGLVETISSRLTQYDGAKDQQLLVVPASEVRTQDAKTASDARKKFGVTAAVEGTLQTQGDRVRLLLTLIDTRNMVQLETIQLEDQRANAFRLQDGAVTRLANALNVRLRGKYASDQARMSPVEPGAYEFYLQARGYLQRSDQMPSVESAITVLKRALEVDARYALAHSALGEAYLYKYELSRDAQWMEQALGSGRRGLELDPNVPETWIAMGRVHLGTGRAAEARADFEKAVELDSRSNEAFVGLANAYAALKDDAKAEATYLKAVSLRPGDWAAYKQLGQYYLRRREFDKALAQWQQVVALSPDNAQGYVNLGALYARRLDWTNAEKVWQQALRLDPVRETTLSNLGKVYYERNDFAKAAEMYERAVKVNPRRYLAWGSLGGAYRGLGRDGDAKAAFAKALELLNAELLVNPNQARLHASVAFYKASSGQPGFEASLDRALRLGAGDADVEVLAAETWITAGNRERALALVKTAMGHGYPLTAVRQSRQLKDLAADLAPAGH